MYNGVGVDESTLRKILAEYTEAKRLEAEANAWFVSSMSSKMVEWRPEFEKAALSSKTYAPKKIDISPEVSFRG